MGKFMKKEITKNIVLITLILSSVLLFMQISFGEKLWPQGYNFFRFDGMAILQSLGFGEQEEPVVLSDVMAPQQIIITTGGKRLIAEENMSEYEDYYHTILNLTQGFFNSGGKITLSNREEWRSAIKTNSIYINYSTAFNSTMWAKFLNYDPAILVDVNSVKNIVINTDTILKKVVLYVKDNQTETYYRIVTAGDAGSMDQFLSDVRSSQQMSNIPFAFEIGFDRSVDPGMTINLTNNTVEHIEMNPFGGFTDELFDKFLQSFGMNKSTTKRYVESDNVTQGLGTHHTFKMYPQGCIEYQAIEETYGVQLYDTTKDKLDTVLTASYDFANTILRSSDTNVTMLVSQGFKDEVKPGESRKVCFDYYVDALPVYYVDQSDPQTISHAVEMDVVDGRIVRYRQMLNLARTEGSVSFIPMIKALDKVFSMEEVAYAEVYTAYVHDGIQTRPVWCMRDKQSDNVTILYENDMDNGEENE